MDREAHKACPTAGRAAVRLGLSRIGALHGRSSTLPRPYSRSYSVPQSTFETDNATEPQVCPILRRDLAAVGRLLAAAQATAAHLPDKPEVRGPAEGGRRRGEGILPQPAHIGLGVLGMPARPMGLPRMESARDSRPRGQIWRGVL